jgi:dolichol-phosphate mannosyltransferase
MIYVILPIYNEEYAIRPLIENLAQCCSKQEVTIVAVNDGSTDRSGEYLRETGKQHTMHIIRHPFNCGLGVTMRDGFAFLPDTLTEYDVIVTMDADGTHCPDHIPAMLDLISRGNDIVIASRYAHGSVDRGVPPLRTMLSAVSNSITARLFPITGVRDYTCGFRAYKGTLITKARREYGNSFITEKGFTCMVEILIKLAWLGAHCVEIPFELRYDIKKTPSKMKVARTIARYFILWTYLTYYHRKGRCL